jgi:predicted CXXCH cytochrome family protein
MRFGVRSGIAGLVLLAVAVSALADVPAYLGSAVCADCHKTKSDAWEGSDHALAWTPPTEAHVLGDFGDVTYEAEGRRARFFRDGARFMIETEGADGVARPFEVVGVAGIDPLQQYLLSPEPGRTQTFDIAWDVPQGRWYPVFAGQDASPGNGFHWTGVYKSWEARCAECHATGYTRNYDVTSRTYAPRMAEIGVGCEACHGPGAAHADWARTGKAPAPGLTGMGLTVDLAASAATETGQCMTCHSRREAIADGNSLPGTDYHGAYTLALLTEGVYHPDGQILDEVFEGGSFLQSKMHAKGVRCSDCHEPHGAGLRAAGSDDGGNAVCAQCHSPAGNPRFPTLPPRVFDGPEHTHHPEGSAGAQCVSCHMIERTYMGIDTRRDHSFRIPRPDLAATGSPDACSDCHADQGAAWAAERIAGWFPDSPHRGPHPATVLGAARSAPEAEVQNLLALAEWQGPGIVRATALVLLGRVGHAPSAGRVAALLADPDPLVRAAATGALRGVPPGERLVLLQPALADPVASVRIAAAKALLDAQPQPGTAQGDALLAAFREWQASLATRLDFPETHLQIGGAALTMRNWQVALQAFGEAVTLDPQQEAAWSMIVRLNAALGDTAAAAGAHAAAMAANPNSMELTQIGLELGLGGGLLPP